MGSLFDQFKSWLHSDLDRRERERTATPAERMDMLQDQIDGDDSLDAVRGRIDRKGAMADAHSELNDAEADDVIDVEAEDDTNPPTADD